jgi:predicted DNA-binding ribbon-helix-helix protein
VKSTVTKRSVVIVGHKTSVCLEDEFWRGLKEIAIDEGICISELIGNIDSARTLGNLSSTIRLFVLAHFRARSITPSTHADAGGRSLEGLS